MLLGLSKLSRILEIDPDNRVARVEPGVESSLRRFTGQHPDLGRQSRVDRTPNGCRVDAGLERDAGDLPRGVDTRIRPSGTEPVIRVMAEGDDKTLVEHAVDGFLTVGQSVAVAAVRGMLGSRVEIWEKEGIRTASSTSAYDLSGASKVAVLSVDLTKANPMTNSQ